jgi:N-acetylglutamate synthase-like GNAT family acetyltransferase
MNLETNQVLAGLRRMAKSSASEINIVSDHYFQKIGFQKIEDSLSKNSLRYFASGYHAPEI